VPAPHHRTAHTGRRLDRPVGLAYGGDYNPEQWDERTRAEDLRLMREAGVTMVTVGVFSWALLEPREGQHDFGWLDRVLDDLAGAGIDVDLATATASPPPWLAHRYPETLPVTREGHRLWPGGRQAWCPSSPVYRERSLDLVERLAERYGGHPALALWHVSNELGCHNVHCYCDVSAAAFRRWLQDRYGDLATLNEAWGTAFWSQHYSDWDQVLPPRAAPTFPNPTQQLDFRRFSSDELLGQLQAETAVLHRVCPDVPVTTNFMATKFKRDMDYWSWAGSVDVVSNDHYLDASDPAGHVELAFSADLSRGLAAGGPWLLMEHSTSAVNWQPRNVAKLPGQLRRDSLTHVARGSEGALFFQWRASRAGAEKFHSGLVPHAGEQTRVFREVCELGAALQALGELRGSTVERADVALVFDWPAWWAAELDSHPSSDLTYLDRVLAIYRALWEQGVRVDLVAPESPLDGYRLVVVPTLYLVEDEGAANLARYAEGGGHLLVTYFSGIVDGSDHVRLGGYPGAFRELLGVRAEEFAPLRRGETVRLDDGSTADLWTEDLHLQGATAVASYVDGPVPGRPAVTRHEVGGSVRWYVATRLDPAATARLVGRVCAEAGARPLVQGPPGLDATRRVGADGTSYLFLINHCAEDATVAARGHDLLRGTTHDAHVPVPAGGVVVLRETKGV
jgi:beta-galactosidase